MFNIEHIEKIKIEDSEDKKILACIQTLNEVEQTIQEGLGLSCGETAKYHDFYHDTADDFAYISLEHIDNVIEFLEAILDRQEFEPANEVNN